MCFNPAVSLTTFLIEIILATALLLQKPHKKINQLGAITLIGLGMYQFSEAMICFQFFQLFFTRFGYMMTAFLPALGIHLTFLLVRKKHHLLFIYLPALLFAGIIIFTEFLITKAQCFTLFVQFFYGTTLLPLLYTIYYILYLLAIFVLLFSAYRRARSSLKPLYFLSILALISFIVPTFIFIILAPKLTAVLGSVLCHFALIFAIMLFILLQKYNQTFK